MKVRSKSLAGLIDFQRLFDYEQLDEQAEVFIS